MGGEMKGAIQSSNLDLSCFEEVERQVIWTVAGRLFRAIGNRCRAWDIRDLVQSGAVGVIMARSAYRGGGSHPYHKRLSLYVRNEILKTIFPSVGYKGQRYDMTLDASSVHPGLEATTKPESETAKTLDLELRKLTGKQREAVAKYYGLSGEVKICSGEPGYRKSQLYSRNAIRSLRRRHAKENAS
jgi:hypothetical protein